MEQKFQVLFLIDDKDYKNYDLDNQEWVTLSIAGEEPDEEEYASYGMHEDDVEKIPEEAWAEVNGREIEVLVLALDDSIEEITIETETEPFTLYDEFGDSMEILYYTDDPDVTAPKLEITANYSPLDELFYFNQEENSIQIDDNVEKIKLLEA